MSALDYQPYAPRPLSFDGVHEVAGFRLKTYTIRYGDVAFDGARFTDGWNCAEPALPQPAQLKGRPGVGFVIQHQGRTGDYFVLCWWDQENELPIRVFVRDKDGWRAARDGESVCVWDLKIIAHERDAYVRTVLGGRTVEDYLAAVTSGEA